MSTFTGPSITKRDASPPVRSNPEEYRGELKAAVGVQQLGIAGAGTLLKLIPVPSNARIHNMEYSRENLGSSSLDITAFYPTNIPQGGAASVAKASEGAVISSSTFVGNILGADAGLGWTDAFGVATTPGLAVQDNPLWQLLGLAEDPEGEIDMGFSVRTANAEAGYVGLRISYVD